MVSDGLTIQAAEFESTAVAWDDARMNARAANPLFVRNHLLAKILRETEEGRTLLVSFLDHENRAVRLLAAGESLQYLPDRASEVLEEIATTRRSDGGVDMHSLTAKTTLSEFRAGRLNMDW